jgi:hypothetical protein
MKHATKETNVGSNAQYGSKKLIDYFRNIGIYHGISRIKRSRKERCKKKKKENNDM